MTTKHPAKFSDSILAAVAPWVECQQRVLDPFAGTGKLAQIIQPPTSLYLNEIEPEWARVCQVNAPAAVVTVGDALHLPYDFNFFTAVVTSPTYGNRMADHHEARDASRRNTYRHVLGRRLHPANSGQLQWGFNYKHFHILAWWEVWRVLMCEGIFVLNVSDHIRDGKVQNVADWHLSLLTTFFGFELERDIRVETPRQRRGANGHLRVDHERVFVLRKRCHL